MKTALNFAKNGDTDDRKVKEQVRAEKANNWTDPNSTNCSEDNHSRAGWKMAQEKQREKVVPRREKGGPTYEKPVILSRKRRKTTMKNSWVDKELTKSPKKKCFDENGAV